jgi:outer membrane receptor for ferrienterochelin and colicins
MKRLKIIHYILTFTLSLLAFAASADGVTGSVFEKQKDGKKLPLAGVNVYWAGTTKGTFTDTGGKFSISRQGITDPKLVFSLLGYGKDTLAVNSDKAKLEVELRSNETELGEVEITGKQDNTFVSKLNARATTVITTGELQRAACCNLAESFETNASVDVSYSDAISGARQIQLLGLSGIYSQIMTENVPLIRGLATPFGLNYIPGSWMESIQVAKGTSSVVQGYESVTGQINVEYKKPETAPKFFLNLFGNSNLRFEGNADAAFKINDKLSTSVLVHGADFRNKFDRNGDGFMDLPKVTTLTAMNRWDYISVGKWVSRFGYKYLYEDRKGGQMEFDPEAQSFDTTGITDDSKKYGIGVTTNRLEAFWKNGIFMGATGKSSLGLILSGINHIQTGFYGINKYDGHEQNFNANLIFTTSFDSTKHRISAGASYIYDNYYERYVQTRLEYRYQLLPPDSTPTYTDLFTLVNDSLYTYNMDRIEWVTGAFFEYTYDNCGKFVLIAGLRGDYNSRYGFLITPRLHLRYNVGKNVALRGSVGKGYHSSNLLAENSAVFVSQRTLYFQDNLNVEEAWNYGINLQWTPTLFKRKAEFTIDAYRTDFVRQIVVDQDSMPTALFFYNLDGKSYANSIQAQFIFSPLERFAITTAFRYNDVRTTEGGHQVRKAMVPFYKGLLSLTYATRHDKWKIDLTAQLNGPQRIPNQEKMPASLQQNSQSPTWVNILAQITKKFKHFDIYLGGENLTNFRQTWPIVEYWKPFHTHFDGSMVWGPVTGITIYAGIRLTIK